MATGWVGFVGPIVGKIGEFLMAPVGRHFGYLFSYKSKVKNLKDEVKKLDEKRGAMQLSVDEAERNVKVIGPDVKGWLERVDKCSEEAREIIKDEVEANKGCLYGWCPNLKLHYSLGKKATNKAKEAAKLHEERKLTQVAYNEPQPWIESTSTKSIKVFESRRLITNDVMEALKYDGFHMIAICGMGGVGKTTMVKEVAKRAKEEKLFDEVVMAVVSQSPNERKIQGEIGDKLGLEFRVETERGRADRLRERIRGTKRILVILDDVWERLELNDIGIPFGDGHRGCKILLTSRFDNVCNDMDAQKKFTVEVLTEEEAWNLFEEMAGIFNDTSHTSTDLYITQKKVADECGCLPIAIVTVARALKDKDRHSWNSALLQLRKSMVKNIRGVEEKVFKSLELSYNFLGSREIKECFLLCSLYAEDFNIPIEDLVRYGVGIELFEAIDSVNEARDRVHAFVDELKKGYLLMDGEGGGCVKMHDVVRDVAISIASREEHSFMVRCDEALKEWPEKERHKNYAVISLRCTGMSKLPDNLEFPKLHLLRLEHNYTSKLPDSFYGGMKEIKALSMLNMYIKGSQPTSLRWLTNLRSLSLYECGQINDVSVIGALENLEILGFEGTRIDELPKEIGQLSHLKLLDLLRCGVKRICPGVLLSLSKLEELYLGSSFNDEHRIEETKATLTELCGLSNFTTLVIHLRCFAYWPRDLVLTNLKAFAITISPMIFTRDSCDYQLQNQLRLGDLYESNLMESGFENLFKITKILEIMQAVGVKNVGYDLDKDGFKKLTELFLKYCQDLEYVIDTTDGVPVPQIAFPVLQWLRLDHLDKLKGICHGQLSEEAFSALKRLELRDLPALTHLWKGPTQLVRLRNLTSLELKRCDKLESMFSLSIARYLMQLQKLDVSKCRKMEVLISSDEEEGDQNEIASKTTDKIVFPKLKELYLRCLPSFTALCKAMNGIELLQLNQLILWGIPKLNSFCNTSDSNYDTIQPLFNKDLKYVIDTTNGVPVPQIAFPVLQWLCVGHLDTLEEICHGQLPEEAFGALQRLDLWDLPALTHLSKGPTQLVWLRNLTSLELTRCHKMESMFSLSIARDLMQLQKLDVSQCRKMEVLISSEEEGDQNEIASTTTETTDKIVFPKLKELYLRGLPSFIALCKAVNGIELLQLNQLILCEIPKLNSFCNSSDSNYDTIQPLFNQVKLFTIEQLLMAQNDNVIEIWPRDLQPKVRDMIIWRCPKLSNILFPSNVIKGMQSLERLMVMWCQSVEVAFNLEGIIVREGYPDIVLPSLTKLVLRYLPKLTHVCKSNLLRIPTFQNLTSLTVMCCSSLRYIFLSSQAELLVKLQEITVTECGVLEAIVNEEPKVDDEVATNIIMFPQLNSLKLCHLPNFKSLCPQAYTFEGSFIKKIKVINCPNMGALPSALQRMLELQESNVRKVDFFNSAQHHLLDRKCSLNTKGILDVTGIDEPTDIWHNQLEVGCLDKVRFMRVQFCGKLSSVVSFKLMQRLHNIQGLKVWWCDSLEMIFGLQEGVCADVAEKETLITQLSKLKLKYLPKLTHIWKNISQQTQRFENLRFLTVQHCDNLRYIFTISMANALVNLRNLTVEDCEKVEKIVTRENEEEIFWLEIMVVNLTNLPSLVCFGPDVNDTEIPARETDVSLCSKFPGNEDGVGLDFKYLDNDFFDQNLDVDDFVEEDDFHDDDN